MAVGERYTRLPVQAVHDLLERWKPSGLRSLESDGSALTIISAVRCSDSAEPCIDPPCGWWWVELRSGSDQYGKHVKDEDWLPVPVEGLPTDIAERSMGDHGYWQ